MRAQRLAAELRAVYLRIDTVEQGLRDLCELKVEGEGYRLCYRLAADNLHIGMSVVADSCNPIELTRREWQNVAQSQGVAIANIEVVCSDPEEHRGRVETRVSTVPGVKLPTWQDVVNRHYEPWHDGADRIVLDTSGRSVDSALQQLRLRLGLIDQRGDRP